MIKSEDTLKRVADNSCFQKLFYYLRSLRKNPLLCKFQFASPIYYRTTVFFFLIVCLFARTTSGQDSPWQFTNRVQLAQEYDSNAEESLHDATGVMDSRLVYQTKIKRAGRRSSLTMGYLGGLSIYNALPAENKLINEGVFESRIRLSNNLYAGINSFGRLKLFLNRDTDYALGSLQPYLNYYAGKGWSLKAGFDSEILDYAQSFIYDYSTRSGFAGCSRRFASGTLIGLTYSHKVYRFDRTTTVLNLEFPLSIERQKDIRNQISLYCDFVVGGWLLNAGYYYENSNSNSYGFSFSRHILNLVAGRDLEIFLLRAFVTLQKKKYTDQFLPSWPTELDSEREQSNFVVLDLSRDLTSTMTAMIRVAWYRNESPWASLYYNKTVLSAGLELRFPGK